VSRSGPGSLFCTGFFLFPGVTPFFFWSGNVFFFFYDVTWLAARFFCSAASLPPPPSGVFAIGLAALQPRSGHSGAKQFPISDSGRGPFDQFFFALQNVSPLLSASGEQALWFSYFFPFLFRLRVPPTIIAPPNTAFF